MNKYRIPVTWEMFGAIEVEAESLEEAIKLAENDDQCLPPDGEYVDGSWVVDSEFAEFLENLDKDDK